MFNKIPVYDKAFSEKMTIALKDVECFYKALAIVMILRHENTV